MNIEKYEDLEKYLEDWVNFHGEGTYDFNGALHLLSAILKNRKKNSIESDFDELRDFFNEDELYILKLMFQKLSLEG
ncbi:MAG: hypothetical protein H0W73_13070 [Bacteroidetes bacterium]|nr:hypothetical protein [Bacteroidota bacterium]